jgi:hypothetical protein
VTSSKGGKGVSTLREQYFRTLGFNENDTASPSQSKREKALNRAYELRSFEIEHYWKRATYFWGFQIAIFAAFGLIWKDPISNQWGPIAVALSLLGILTALANYLSARGSKFWQRNWEMHIDMLEDEIEGRLYKTVWLPDGKVSFSVSRINLQLGVCMGFFWVLIAAFVTCKFILCQVPDWYRALSLWWPLSIVIFLWICCVIGAVWLLAQTSEFSGTLPPEGEEDRGPPIKRSSRWHERINGNPLFICRNAPDD